MIEKRNKMIDILKCISIILVLLGHSIQYGSGSIYYQEQLFFNNTVFKAIYSFHMFLFALLSGYLYYYSLNNKKPKEVFVSKVRTLLVPVLTWTIISLFPLIIVSNEVISLSTILKYYNILILSFWFLSAIFANSLIVLFVDKLKKIYVYLLVLLAMFLIPDYGISKFICFLYIPYLLGFLVNKYNIISKINYNSNKYYYLIALIVSFFLMFFFYKNDIYIYVSGFSILKPIGINFMQIYYDFYRWLIGLIGSAIVIIMVDLLYRHKENRFMNYLTIIGSNTLGIYIVSTYIFILLLKVTDSFSHNIVINIFETFVILILSSMLTFFIKKNKWISKFLLGTK